ncbi:hypothetical protein, partial [Porphyromonas gingivalis]|uniref:hypothetical protein n=1 Tax=Porphyromonas gingivalis TaxID=837 RepID=UPI001C53D18B
MRQVEALRYGFPYPNIIAPASLENGIMRLDEDDKSAYLLEWDVVIKICFLFSLRVKVGIFSQTVVY